MLKEYFKVLYSWKKTILLISTAGLLLASLMSFISPFEYKATTGLLILPKATVGLDAYSAIKTSERIGENLATIVYTSSFFDKLEETGYNIDFSYFNQKSKSEFKTQWGNMVSAYVKYNTGLLYIDVYHESQEQAVFLAQGISSVLINHNDEYLAHEGFVEVKMVDEAIVSDKPVKPNFLRNALLGFFASFFLVAGLIIINSDEFKKNFV
jgi:capsular polysaccharide biosynthesis protein